MILMVLWKKQAAGIPIITHKWSRVASLFELIVRQAHQTVKGIVVSDAANRTIPSRISIVCKPPICGEPWWAK
jgi:hypothetical protein